MPDFASGFVEQSVDPFFGTLYKVVGGMYAIFLKHLDAIGAESPDFFSGNPLEKEVDVATPNGGETVGLAVIGGDFTESFGEAEPDGDGQIKLFVDGLLHGAGNLFVGHAVNAA